jgi:hypothetical protein
MKLGLKETHIWTDTTCRVLIAVDTGAGHWLMNHSAGCSSPCCRAIPIHNQHQTSNGPKV